MIKIVRTTYVLRGTEFSRIDPAPTARAFARWLAGQYPAITIQQEEVS